MGFGPLWKGVGLQRERGVAVTQLTVEVSNDLQMARNLTSGLPVLYQGRLANLGPFRESLTPAHETRSERGATGAREWSGLRTENGENRENPNGCKF